MSRKWTKVYICDWCQAVKMPETYYCIDSVLKGAPQGWQRVGSMDLCDKCFAKFSKIMGEGEEDNAED